MSCWQNLPEKFIERVRQIVPDERLNEVLKSYCDPKPISIRINTLKTDKDTLIDLLNKNDIKTDKVSWHANALLIKSGSKRTLVDSDLFKNGFFYIQSLSSMIPALILDPKPNESILDIAAAPGSKTTQIAQLMKNTGSIVANDISPKRLFKLKSILDIQGVENVKITQIPGEFIYKKYPNCFDKVIVDAPCTMEGRFNTNDPLSYKDWSLKKIKILSFLQKRMLRSAFYAAKPGGVIVYSTCTLSPEENEGVVNWLLKEEGKHVKLEGIEIKINHDIPIKVWKKTKFDESIINTMRIFPSLEMEGFFVAKIRRLS